MCVVRLVSIRNKTPYGGVFALALSSIRRGEPTDSIGKAISKIIV